MFHEIFGVCFHFQLNRSDSDSSTLSKKPPFVRNAMERRSVRVKRVKTSLLVFCLAQTFIKKMKTVLKEEFANVNQLPSAFVHNLFCLGWAIKATFP